MSRLFSDAYSVVAVPELRRACALAERGAGTTAPNPLVGCVLTRDGETVGEGWHERAGGPHAEAAALAAAGERARGATAYVTLEPCTHQGRTPACAGALVAAGVARVVVGMRDPNPRVSGGGIEALRAAGVDVEVAEDDTPFRELNRAWLMWLAEGRPRVRGKVALTLDGRPALRSGERATITGDAAAELTARLRRESGAVAVGRSTLEADDPALTVRDAAGKPTGPQPLRVVLCSTGAPRPDARVFTDGAGPVAIVAPEGVAGIDSVPGDVRVLPYDADEGLAGALRALGAADVTDLLVETGPRLFERLWTGGLIDDLVVYHAGWVAGASAPPLYGGEAGGPGSGMSVLEAGTAGRDAVTVWRSRETPRLVVAP